MASVVDLARLQRELNQEQVAAAAKTEGPALILAGAGSGKTRTITYKIAHLISAKNVDPRRILAVTFTNKAAREMKTRIQQILEGRVNLEWMGTFHSICVRILRLCLANDRILQVLGWKINKNFSIYDDDDQRKMLKEIMKPIFGDDLDAKALKQARSIISKYKNSVVKEPLPAGGYRIVLQTPTVALEHAAFPDQEKMAGVYRDYQAKLAEANAMDFDDLLLNTVELLQKLPQVAAQFANRFLYVVVDEYQDTNDVQYELLKLLIDRTKQNVTVVGDDDQSIYGWRGANIDIIRNFSRDFDHVTFFKLERNYRSSANIVKGAGSVIAHNERPEEMKKNVYSAEPAGDPIHVVNVLADTFESEQIAKRIFEAGKEQYAKTAIFYRTNAQSRAIEKALNDLRIPCVIFGGTRFWDRKEIRDILAYMRLLANPKDDAAFLRIVNTPPRGIGNGTLDALRLSAEANNSSLWEAIPTEIEKGGRSAKGLENFKNVVELWLAMLQNKEALPIIAEHVIRDSFYKEFLKKEDESTAEERERNLDEMVNAFREFEEENPDKGLDEFLQEISLLTDADKKVESAETRVTLMTIHMAKGLEFETVHIAGCDEGIFPLIRESSMTETPDERKKQAEEERRLFYVGCTRAKRKRYLYHAGRRFWQGSLRRFPPSRFLEEIDPMTVSVEGKCDDDSEQSFTGEPWNQGFSGFGGRQRPGFGNRLRPQYGAYRGPSSSGSSSISRGSYGRNPERATGLHKTERIVYKNPQVVEKVEKGPRLVYDENCDNPLHKGVRVQHLKFGRGVVIGISGAGENARVEVRFSDGNVRKLILKYAGLQILD